MEEPPPIDEKALDTRRATLLVLFEARMGRWQPVQSASFALVTLALAAFLGFQLSLNAFLSVVFVASLAVAVSAGVQSAYQATLEQEMRTLEAQYERLKRGRMNL